MTVCFVTKQRRADNFYGTTREDRDSVVGLLGHGDRVVSLLFKLNGRKLGTF